jgi:single-strand DNA-binding protein
MTLKITAIGNITRDSELKNLGDSEVLNFSIARNDRRTKEVTFIDCSIWGKLATSLAPYTKKGQQVYVEGELTTREYNGKTYISCRVRDVELLGNNAKQQADEGRSQGYDQGNQTQGSNSRDVDDEIPF